MMEKREGYLEQRWLPDGSDPGRIVWDGSYHNNTSIALPVHIIELDKFYMDVTEVTNIQYQVLMQ